MRVNTIRFTGDHNFSTTTSDGTVLFHVTWAAKAFALDMGGAIFSNDRLSVSSD
jgi:hypothetical protein